MIMSYRLFNMTHRFRWFSENQKLRILIYPVENSPMYKMIAVHQILNIVTLGMLNTVPTHYKAHPYKAQDSL